MAALALRGVAENFAAGVVIQTRRPIQLGDDIRAVGHGGVVRELNGRSVVIETDDGQTVHLPNSKVLDNPIVNNSTTAAHRTEVEVRSAGSDDVDATVEAILAATTAVAGVLADPAPVVLVRAIAPEEVTTVVRFWHDPSSGALVASAVVRGIAIAERSRGIVATVVTATRCATGPAIAIADAGCRPVTPRLGSAICGDPGLIMRRRHHHSRSKKRLTQADLRGRIRITGSENTNREMLPKRS